MLSPPPSIDTHKNLKFNRFRGDELERKDKSQGYKKEDSFVVPKHSREDRARTNARIQAALNQVDQAVHFKLEGKRTTTTLYVGNSEFNASEQDLHKALDRLFKRFGWRRLQYQELMADRNTDSSRYHGHIVRQYRFSTCASYTLG